MLWFLLRSFDKHLYNFSYKLKNIDENSKTLLFVNSGTTKSFKKLKEDRRQTKDGHKPHSMQGSSTVPARRALALQPHSMHCSSKVPEKWTLAIQPRSMLGSSTVPTRWTPAFQPCLAEAEA